MLVAGSGVARKSSSVKTAVNMLRDVEPDRVGPSDFTAEALLSFMAKKPDGGEQRSKILIPMEEFGQYLSSAASYGTTTAATLCALYDGEDYERVRAGGANFYISNPRVSIIAAVAFGMMEKYADSRDWTTGFFNRFLFVIPERTRPRFDTIPPWPAQEADRARAALKDLAVELENTPGPMTISQEAESVFKKLVEVVPPVDDDPIAASARERLLNSVWKLAMLYQIDAMPGHLISAGATDKACAFAFNCWKAFRAVYAQTASTDLARLVKQVQSFIEAYGPTGVPKRNVYRKFHISAEKLNTVLDIAVKWGLIYSTVSEIGLGKKREILHSFDDKEWK